MEPTAYKEYHESFMQNNNGTTQIEILAYVVPTSYTTFLTSILLFTIKPSSNLFRFIYEFIIIVLPIILSVTFFSNHVSLLHNTLFSITLSVFIKILYKILFTKRNFDILSIPIPNLKRDYISNVRAIINITTAVCILAVDFQIFPRRLAKTENYGFGLMDAGVGLYVFANGIIAPEIYKPKLVSVITVIKSQLTSTIPLVVLGLSRFIVTKEIDYHQHVSEYGVHWNFFITLAFTKLMGTVLISMFRPSSTLTLAMVITLVHDIVLCQGVSSWVLSDVKRDSFLMANREGISSLMGYIALYLFSVRLGYELHIKTNDLKDNIKLVVRLTCYALLLHILTFIYHQYFGVSRRLGNFGYSTFILSIALTMTLLFLISELFITIWQRIEHPELAAQKVDYMPLLYTCVNSNGLVFFLVSNLLTGFVNLTTQTMLVDNLISVYIIIIYMLTTCAFITVVKLKEINLKIW